MIVSLDFIKIFLLTFLIYLSGNLKWLPYFNLDITLLVALLLFIFFFYDFFKSNFRIYVKKKNLFILILFFFLIYILSFTYTISESFWIQKLSGLVLSLYAFILPIIFVNSHKKLDLLFNLLIFFGLIINIIFLLLVYFDSLDLYRKGVIINGYQVNFPDYLSLGSCIGISYFASLKLKYKYHIPIFLITIFNLLVLHGRGPLFFLIIITFFYLIFGPFKKFLENLHIKKNIFYYILLILFILLIFIYFEKDFLLLLFDAIIRRTKFLFDYKDYSEEILRALRFEIFSNSFEIIKDNFVFGVGLGGYAQAAYNEDINAYPHNLFLEVFVELGICGFLIFVLINIIAFNISFSILRKKNGLIISLMFYFIFLNYMKSGGMIWSKDYFFLIGLIISFCNFKKTKIINE
jgi:O-antigen ligase